MTKLKIFQHRQLLVLGIALGFLFFGWNAAEQHLTSFYQTTEGQAATGLNLLAILYASIIVGSFLGPMAVKKFGLKLTILFGFMTYTLLVFGVVSKINPLVYLLSVLLGIGSGVSGVAQIDLIRLFSPQNLRGELSGSIHTFRTIGGGLGILSVSLLLRLLRIETVYLGLGSIMSIGFLALFFLKIPPKKTEEEKILPVIKKTLLMFKESKLLLTIPTLVANGFLLGLVLGAVPVSITKTYGIEYVGLIMPFFHFTLAFSSLCSGRLSDRIGRLPVLYSLIAAGMLAAILVLRIPSVFLIILAMLLVGFSASIGTAVAPALYIDLFGQEVKEAQAASGIMATFLGMVSAFILNKYFSTPQLLYLAILLYLVGGFSLRVLEVKSNKRPKSNTLEVL